VQHTALAFGDQRSEAVVQVDFRFLCGEERTESTWVKRSAESSLESRLVWICGATDQVDTQVRELARSRAMVKKFKPRRESLNAARKLLLQQEKIGSKTWNGRFETPSRLPGWLVECTFAAVP